MLKVKSTTDKKQLGAKLGHRADGGKKNNRRERRSRKMKWEKEKGGKGKGGVIGRVLLH